MSLKIQHINRRKSLVLSLLDLLENISLLQRRFPLPVLSALSVPSSRVQSVGQSLLTQLSLLVNSGHGSVN